MQHLHDRQSELDLARAALDAVVDGEGGVLAFEGAPGIGKTALLEWTRRTAREQGVACLTARGGELESAHPFGVVRQLLERRVLLAGEAEREELLAGAAALARPVLGLGGEDAPDLPETFEGPAAPRRLHGLFWLAANVAMQRPLALLVDDAHWADLPSLKWLAYLGTRARDVGILLVLSARSPRHGPASDLLDSITSGPEADGGLLEPLGRDAVAAIVRDRLGEADDDLCRACHVATGGNPFFVTELAAEIGRGADVAGAGPARVGRNVIRRIAALPQPAPRLAEAVAVMGARCELRHAAALTAIDEPAAAAAAAHLVDAGIIAPRSPLRFVHPIVRTAIYRSLPQAVRGDMHARIARVLAEEGEPLGQVAAHLLKAPVQSEPWVVETLRAAAAEAIRQGTPAAAAEQLRRALEETGPGALRHAVLTELGLAELQAGEASAMEHLEAALDAVDEPERRAELAIRLARAQTIAGRLHAAVHTVRRELDRGDALDSDTTLRLDAELVNASRLDTELWPIAKERLALLSPDLRGAGRGERLLLAQLAHATVIRGRPAFVGAEMARRALAGGALLADEGCESPSLYVALWTLALCDEHEEAHAGLSEAVLAAQEAGSALGFQMATCFRSNVAFRVGRLAEAEADVRCALDAAQPADHPLAVAYLLDVLVERGRLDEAEEVLRRTDRLGPLPHSLLLQPLLYVRGRLRIAQGQLEAGVDDILECGRLGVAMRERTAAFRPWRSVAGLALAELGDVEEGRRLVEEEAALARRFGGRRALGISLRALGLLADGDERMALLREAEAALEAAGARLELARVRTDAGAAIRRSGDRSEARRVLRDALELAAACGGDAIAEHARTELAAAGSRARTPERRGVDALTPSERRVADMAAQGRTNREIAQALFVTPKTVEWHLAQSYRKLDIASRRMLPAVLAQHAAVLG